MKTLYVSDLDGTLLNSNSEISERSAHILNMLVDKGIAFTFATARSIHSASKVTNNIKLNTGLIVYNGVYIVDPMDYHILYQHAFKKVEAEEILNDLLAHQQYPFVYAYINGEEKVSYIEEKLHAGGMHYISSRPNDQRFRRVRNLQELYEGEVFYMTCIDDKEKVVPLFDRMEELYPYTMTCQKELQRMEYWFEIMPGNVSKANAILELKRMGGYDRIISFGDAVNDLPMFRISDECYAVANAIDEVKDAATAILSSNDEEAVAVWLLENAQ